MAINSTIGAKYTIYRLKLNLSLERNAALAQNSVLKLLICIKDLHGSSSYSFKIITLDIGVTDATITLALPPTEDDGTQIQFCPIGYFVLSWKSLVQDINANLIFSYAENPQNSEAEQALINAIITAAPTFYEASPEGIDPGTIPAEKKYITNPALNVCTNTFSVTGDFAGGDVDTLTNTSAWSLGNELARWKNVYAEKAITDYTYSDTVAPQKNYHYVSTYLKATSPSTTQVPNPESEPIVYLPLKANNPDELFNFYRVSADDTLYSAQIMVDGQLATCYIDSDQFKNTNAYEFKLYSDEATENPIPNKYLERIVVEGLYDELDNPTTNESECYLKVIKIGQLENPHGYAYFYCYGTKYQSLHPDAKDFNVYMDFDNNPSGEDSHTILLDQLKLDENGNATIDPDAAKHFVTMSDLAVSNVVYKYLKKSTTTVGVDDNKFDTGYFKTLYTDNIRGTVSFPGTAHFNGSTIFNIAPTFNVIPKFDSLYPMLGSSNSKPIKMKIVTYVPGSTWYTAHNTWYNWNIATLDATKIVIIGASAIYKPSYNPTYYTSYKRNAPVSVNWIPNPSNTNELQLWIYVGPLTYASGDELTRLQYDEIQVVYYYIDK